MADPSMVTFDEAMKLVVLELMGQTPRGGGRCVLCGAPCKRLREGRCIYCDFSTHGGQIGREQGDRAVARRMLAEEPHDATARLERGLRSERLPVTATAKMLALPHPW